MGVLKKSPLAPADFPAIPPVPGVELGAIAAGLRYQGRPDLMMACFMRGAAAAGVFTKSLAAAAPVIWSREALAQTGGRVRALIVNAGNANAFTGRRGLKTSETMAKTVAEMAGCAPQEVLVASTGVIGATMAPGPLRRGIKRLEGGLSNRLYREAAEAIRTTDTFPKGAFRIATIDNQPVTIAGIAKGSGMIEPDMATMLGFLFTSAPIEPDLLQAILQQSVATTFNAISVDGDTSTNDCVLAFATGGEPVRAFHGLKDPRLADFIAKFKEVCRDLAHQIIKDGEGASKFVTIEVTGAETHKAAKQIAMTVARSPLVKTAIAGEDPNWGRVVAAASRAGEMINMETMQLWIGDALVAHKGMVHLRYDETVAAEHMKQDYVTIRLDAGVGAGAFTVWTCDFTEEYIKINADYRS